jgi:hypothetical protein
VKVEKREKTKKEKFDKFGKWVWLTFLASKNKLKNREGNLSHQKRER